MNPIIDNKRKYHPQLEHLLKEEYWKKKWEELQKRFEYSPNGFSKSDLKGLSAVKSREKKKITAVDFEKAFRRSMNIFAVLYERCGVIPRDIEEIKQNYAEKPLKKEFYKGMEKTSLYDSLREYRGLSSNNPAQKHVDLLIQKEFLAKTRVPRGIEGNPILITFGRNFLSNEPLLKFIYSAFEDYMGIETKIEHIVFRFLLQKFLFEPLTLHRDVIGVDSLLKDFMDFLGNRKEFTEGITPERRRYFAQVLSQDFLRPILELFQIKENRKKS